MGKILITGATGLIGTRLTELLLQKGYEVAHLARTKRKGNKVQTFTWDINGGVMESEAMSEVDTVIHLAGAGVADKRWTASWKREILESRVRSTALLAQHLMKNPQVKTFVAASAIGYYGFGSKDMEFTEESKPGDDYLAGVVCAWENEVDKIQARRVVKLRTGIVLSERGGALKKMTDPIRWGVGAPLGTGEQYLSWIHLDDLCHMFIRAVEDSTMNGVYNATSPSAITNLELTQSVARKLNKPLWLPAVPAFVLNIILGEMAEIVLNGSVVSSKKIQNAGFQFQFPDLDEALENLLKK